MLVANLLQSSFLGLGLVMSKIHVELEFENCDVIINRFESFIFIYFLHLVCFEIMTYPTALLLQEEDVPSELELCDKKIGNTFGSILLPLLFSHKFIWWK